MQASRWKKQNALSWPIDGRVNIHWFDVGESNNQDVYLNVLKNDIWPKIKNNVIKRNDYFKQDGAASHTAMKVGFYAWRERD